MGLNCYWQLHCLLIKTTSYSSFGYCGFFVVLSYNFLNLRGYGRLKIQFKLSEMYYLKYNYL